MEGFTPIESIEEREEKYHYTFTDGSVLGSPMIFECDADDVVLAQEKFLTFVQESNIDISVSDIRRSEIKN
jgi:hypothetical protein